MSTRRGGSISPAASSRSPCDGASGSAGAAALGFHGYAAELHVLYEALVRSPRPRLFFDVGASYGLRVTADIHAVSVAPSRGSAHLVVTGDATYLGTIVPAVGERWANRSDVTMMTVPQVTLDGMVEEARRGTRPREDRHRRQ